MDKGKISITEPPEYIPLLFELNGKELGRLEFKKFIDEIYEELVNK